jgi:transcriptional regulator with XRE-family HTH domain
MNKREYRQAVGDEIRRLRKGLGLIGPQFGKKLKLSNTQVYRIEAGSSGLRTDTLPRLAHALGVRPSAMLAAVEARLGLGPRPKPAPELPASVGPLEYRRRVGMVVRRRRWSMGLTTTQVSKRIGISQAQMTRLETGQQGFRFNTFLRMAEALRMRPSELLAAAEPIQR